MLKGILHGFFETGCEGTMFAIQQYEHIKDGKWDYEGLHFINPGDHLIVMKDDSIVLDVVLDDYVLSHEADINTVLVDEPDIVAKWEKYPKNPIYGQLHINNYWVHWLPKNVDLKLWYDIFFEYPYKYDGILVKKTKREN